MKHANAQVVTASTDSVDFLRPIKTGDITSYEAMVSYACITNHRFIRSNITCFNWS
jgi:acyl-CoA hydrolase